jgi:hypothetical protein
VNKSFGKGKQLQGELLKEIQNSKLKTQNSKCKIQVLFDSKIDNNY